MISTYAVVKTLQNQLWDVRVTNVNDKWKLEPVLRAARLVIKSMGQEVPTTVK